MSTSDSVPRQGQGGQTEDWPAHGDGGGTPLSVRHEQAGSAMLLTLAGELDVTVTDSVRAAVGRCLREQPERLLVDLRALAFCDCAGARTLRWAQDQAAAAGTRFQLTGAGPMVIRILTLTRAATLLAAARADDHAHDGAEAVRPAPAADPSPSARPGTDVAFLAPPAPAPEAVDAARRHLNEQYAVGVDRLLWDRDKRPMPDQDAIQQVIAAAGNASPHDITAALILTQAARLGLDRAEHDIFDVALRAGASHEAIAATLDLPGAEASAARQRWLAGRRALAYEEPGPLRPGVPGGPAEAAARAGRRARQAAERAAGLRQYLDQLSSASEQRPPPGREGVERSAAQAGRPASWPTRH